VELALAFVQNWLIETWHVLLEAGPWLVGGFLLAGVIHVVLPTSFVVRHLGTRGLAGVIKAALLGVPLPLCSCSVIPVAATIRSQGASRGSTASFLISTPETGADSIALSYALLGPVLAVARPVAAFLTATLAGGVIDRLPEPRDVEPMEDAASHGQHGASCCHEAASPTPAPAAPAEGTCCHSGSDHHAEPATAKSAGSSCCHEVREDAPPVEPQNSAAGCCCSSEAAPAAGTATAGGEAPPNKWIAGAGQAVRYAFGRMFADLGHWLAIGFVLAGLVGVLVPKDFFEQHLGTGLGAMLLMVLVGLPFYVCATSSTPIAASLLMKGLSPGAALVFLLVGPATNLATIVVVGKTLGRRNVIVYVVSIIVVAIGAGLLVDAFWPTAGVAGESAAHAHSHFGLLAVLSAILLICLMLNGMRLKFLR
jgi:uncharacterized membrane protein YraQ (UPF0718 family)